jgi:hypothetical protein
MEDNKIDCDMVQDIPGGWKIVKTYLPPEYIAECLAEFKAKEELMRSEHREYEIPMEGDDNGEKENQ